MQLEFAIAKDTTPLTDWLIQDALRQATKDWSIGGYDTDDIDLSAIRVQQHGEGKICAY